MLRTAFVLGIFAIAMFFALQGAFYALLMYLWIAYFRPMEWVWTDFIQTLNLSLIAGVYLVVISFISGQRHRINGRVLLLAAFLLQNVISLGGAESSSPAWLYLQDFAKTTVITYLIMVLVTDRARLRLALLVLALSLSFEPAKQAWMQFVLDPGGQNFNPIGFLGDESGVGVGMLMLAPIIGLLARTSAKRWQRWGLRFLGVGVLYRAITTYSRGAFLGLGMLAAMYLLKSRYRLRALIAATVLALLIVPGLPEAFWDRMATIPMTQDEMDDSARGRVYFWTVAIRMANDLPLTGVGHMSYNSHYDEYDTSDGYWGPERSVHSAWFGVLGELGYPGIVLFVLNVAAALVALRRVRRIAKSSPQLADLAEYAAAFEVAFAAFAVAASFISFQYVEMLWHYMGFSAALLAIARSEQAALVTAPAPASRSAPARQPAGPIRPAARGNVAIPAATRALR